MFPDKPVEFEGTKGIDLLTPEESIEAWKRKPKRLIRPMETILAKKLVEEYSKEESSEDAI